MCNIFVFKLGHLTIRYSQIFSSASWSLETGKKMSCVCKLDQLTFTVHAVHVSHMIVPYQLVHVPSQVVPHRSWPLILLALLAKAMKTYGAQQPYKTDQTSFTYWSGHKIVRKNVFLKNKFGGAPSRAQLHRVHLGTDVELCFLMSAYHILVGVYIFDQAGRV